MKKITNIILPLTIGAVIAPTTAILSSCSNKNEAGVDFTMSKTVAEWKNESYSNLAQQFGISDDTCIDCITKSDDSIINYLIAHLGTKVEFFEFLACAEMYTFASLLGYSDDLNQTKYDNDILSVDIKNLKYENGGFSCTLTNSVTPSGTDYHINNDGVSSFKMCGKSQQGSQSISQIFATINISNAQLTSYFWLPHQGIRNWEIGFQEPQIYTYDGVEKELKYFCDVAINSTWFEAGQDWVTNQAKTEAQNKHTYEKLVSSIFRNITFYQ